MKVEELINNLEDTILSMGVTSNFKENPAFETNINKIKSMLKNISEDTVAKVLDDHIEINKEDNQITIFKINENEFGIRESKTTALDKQVAGTALNAKHKIINDFTVALNNNGTITTVDRIAGVRNDDVNNYNESKVSSSIRTDKYNKFGIQTETITKEFEERIVSRMPEEINAAICFASGIFDNNNYKSYTSVGRIGLDVARVKYDNKETNQKYSSLRQLSTEGTHLRNMHIPGYIFLPEVKINQMTKNEIDEIISRENNPKIAEGLRELANGRELYYYNSEEDQDFVCEVGKENKVR